MIPAIVLFVVSYVLILLFGDKKHWISLVSAALFVLLGIFPIGEVVQTIDWNVLLMMLGMMGLVSLFIESKMPNLLADIIMEKVPNVQIAAVSLALFTGIISAFVDNVATVLMIAPVAIAVCKKLNTNPVPFIICIAVSSNLQGAATLVGDTTAIMLGSALNMSFTDFFFYNGKPSMFFAVELGAIVSSFIVAFMFRKNKEKIEKSKNRTLVTDYVPTILLLGNIAALIVASFVPNKPDITNGLISCTFFLIGLVRDCITGIGDRDLKDHLASIDVKTLGFLTGLFLMIGGIEKAGVITALSNVLAGLGNGNMFLMFTAIVVASMLISAFIDNIPYVATMIPVIAGIATQMGIDATPLYFGLLSGATLGGNMTPIGASANITAIGILKKEGFEVKNSDFLKIGIPSTFASIVPAYIYIWVFYGI